MKIGDVVQLRSGGPKMTILEKDKDIVKCGWFENQSPQLVRYPILALIRLEEA